MNTAFAVWVDASGSEGDGAILRVHPEGLGAGVPVTPYLPIGFAEAVAHRLMPTA